MPPIGELLQRLAGPSLGMAERLLAGVTPARFARFTRPAGVTVHANHPAWVYGHLALYPARVMEIGGLTAPVGLAPPAAWTDLFGAGTECKDDPEAAIYPAMGEVTERFFTGYRALTAALAEVPDEVFHKPHAGSERMREMMPTFGQAAAFMVGSHIMMHLGQVSTWRRCEGLSAAM